jgi:Squalene-hopene cyclase C-terminal domain
MKEELSPSSFPDRAYLAPLRKLQNEDGGWGFNAGRESRIEPTAWALLALNEFGSSKAAEGAIERGLRFLTDTQLPDGSWPAAAGQEKGCWVTSLACWALLVLGQSSMNLRNGLLWLKNDRPRDSGFLWRLARKLTERKRINAQNPAYSGWSWTPHTASWVEPTCYALMVQRGQTVVQLPDSRKICELAEGMLYDRMCPGGGWNCGNPRVYGAAGQPQVGPTVWALVALREHSQRSENRQSLDWLESNQPTVRSPESRALTHLGLNVYGRIKKATMESAYNQQESASPPWSVQALSWAALAHSEASRWLNLASSPNS